MHARQSARRRVLTGTRMTALRRKLYRPDRSHVKSAVLTFLRRYTKQVQRQLCLSYLHGMDDDMVVRADDADATIGKLKVDEHTVVLSEGNCTCP